MINFILFLVGLVIYFLPSLIAKDKKDATTIFLVNLFTGWTFIGWVASFIWALVTPEIKQIRK